MIATRVYCEDKFTQKKALNIQESAAYLIKKKSNLNRTLVAVGLLLGTSCRRCCSRVARCTLVPFRASYKQTICEMHRV